MSAADRPQDAAAGGDAPRWYVEAVRRRFARDPGSVDASWRAYFRSHPREGSGAQAPTGPHSARTPPPPPAPPAPEPRARREAGPPAAPSNSVSVTRSDLPPAPPSETAEATSPYTRQQRARAAAALGREQLAEDRVDPLRAAARTLARTMEESLRVPTATSAREVPAKLLIENRQIVNAHLRRTRGGKVSYTHLIGYALVEALVEAPALNVRYVEEGGKPSVEREAHVGFGLAIDVTRADGARSLIVPVVREADTLTFPQFIAAYEDLVRRARQGVLKPDDLRGATVTLTNPGTLGTTQSVPRLVRGQGLIVGVGALDYPAEWAGASPRRLAAAGVGKVMTLTSTYDHRVIQGAASGELLGAVARKLMGADDFFDRVFDALRVPYPPYHWERDHEYDLEREKGKPARIAEIIHAYRSRGHLAADTDPLAYKVRRHPDLDIATYGLSVWDLDRPFPTGGFGGADTMLLRDVLARLRDTYTRTIGIEYMHIQDPEQRQWVQRRIEQPYEKPDPAAQRHILSTLIHAEAFEEFLQTKYIGQKRFSLEGGESLIPLLDAVLSDAAHAGLHEVGIGMAHRGRLNVLANIAGKSYAQIFSEFEGNEDPRTVQGSGDVKYHLGTEGIFQAEEGIAVKVHIAANPSHLEAASGVLEGIVRAKQDELGDPDMPVLPILIHGDAAFVGQGVVQEVLNMSQLAGYRTGGTLHIVVDNQIGFTTGPTSGRSTRYPTDLAKGLQVPIFHVNGDDPEAVVRCATLAFDYRERFHKDVIVDMVCYRRRGHNEADDPSMTQPVMYDLIDRLPSTRAVYTRNLVGRGELRIEDARASRQEYAGELGRILAETRERGPRAPADGRSQAGLEVPESQLPGQGLMLGWRSASSPDVLARVGDAYAAFPPDFTPHKRVAKVCARRRAMAHGEEPVDWGFAEILAFGTLLMEGTPVRLAGQDSRRGTFAQRHAVLHDRADGREFTPLDFLTEDQAGFAIYDSPLSEDAPLAFEYGYSVERPEALVAWEAQFGDFVDGAQTVVDEFIASARSKWGQRSSVVLLLPHGYEGQGPDHSSARIERFLSLAAEGNLWICEPSTAANHFHMLRTQAYRRPRTPLIAFTPKQLLRLPGAASPLADFARGAFRPVIGEVDPQVRAGAADVRRVLACSGRVYYDLARERRRRGAHDVAIVRVEQLYPLPDRQVAEALQPFGDAELVWVQDEPHNQGAWAHVALNLGPALGRPLRAVTRPASASPAPGRVSLHREQAQVLVDEAFAR